MKKDYVIRDNIEIDGPMHYYEVLRDVISIFFGYCEIYMLFSRSNECLVIKLKEPLFPRKRFFTA
jgi:hypothetical protein